jgi:hydrogenase/urease accessory protein HupE
MGFLAATALLHVVGLGVGKGVQRLVDDLGLRAMGGLVLAGEAWVLVAH